MWGADGVHLKALDADIGCHINICNLKWESKQAYRRQKEEKTPLVKSESLVLHSLSRLCLKISIPTLCISSWKEYQPTNAYRILPSRTWDVWSSIASVTAQEYATHHPLHRRYPILSDLPHRPVPGVQNSPPSAVERPLHRWLVWQAHLLLVELPLEALVELDFEPVWRFVPADRLWGAVDGRRLGHAYHQLDAGRIRFAPVEGQVGVGQVRVVEVDFEQFLAEVLVVLVEEFGRFEGLAALRVLLAGPEAEQDLQEVPDPEEALPALLGLFRRLLAGSRRAELEGQRVLFLVSLRHIQFQRHHHLHHQAPKDACSSS
jgi:hypothetical protein